MSVDGSRIVSVPVAWPRCFSVVSGLLQPTPPQRRRALALAMAGATLALGLLNPLSASAAESAKYRVTATAFAVKTQTWDDAFQWDGKCDEVFLSSTADRLSKTTTSYTSTYEGPTMGDVNGYPSRRQAGSCSSLGGIKTDDTVTVGTNLWEGTLVQGEDLVTITPSLWEWDTGPSAIQGWIDWGHATFNELRPRLDSMLGAGAKTYLDWTQFGLDVAVRLKDVTGTSGTRPVGMTLKPNTTNEYEFKPQTLLLTYESAAQMAADSGPEGQGSIFLTYADADKLQGRYMLKLKVTRLDPPAPTAEPSAPRATGPNAPTSIPSRSAWRGRRARQRCRRPRQAASASSGVVSASWRRARTPISAPSPPAAPSRRTSTTRRDLMSRSPRPQTRRLERTKWSAEPSTSRRPPQTPRRVSRRSCSQLGGSRPAQRTSRTRTPPPSTRGSLTTQRTSRQRRSRPTPTAISALIRRRSRSTTPRPN
jgi:hypothetical protein